MSELSIRDMQPDDIAAVMEIERLSFSMPWSVASFLHEINNSFAMAKVAVLADSVAGYICVNLILDECHILNLAVRSDARRKGIATELMKYIIRVAIVQGCKFFYLEVRFSNIGARTFYERFGFRIAGVRRNYYVSPVEDAAIMMLKV